MAQDGGLVVIALLLGVASSVQAQGCTDQVTTNTVNRGRGIRVTCGPGLRWPEEVTRCLSDSHLQQDIIPTAVTIEGCPHPGGNQTYSDWIRALGINPESMITLEVKSCNNRTLFEGADFVGLPNLKKLTIWKHQIVTLASDIFKHVPGLRALDIRMNNIKDLPTNFFETLPSLEYIDVTRNQLSVLPSLEKLTNLKKLLIARNQMESLPSNLLWNNTKLSVFKATNSGIKKLPHDLFNSTKTIKYIHLDDNNLTSIPDFAFEGLSSLNTLNLKRNQIRSIPKSAFDGMKKLKVIDLEENELTSPIAEIFAPIKESVKKINLGWNLLTEFEYFWVSMMPQNLKILDLRNNMISGSIDTHLISFQTEVEINLQENMIKRVILKDENSKHTVRLNIEGNQIENDCFKAKLIQHKKKGSYGIQIEMTDEGKVDASRLQCPFPSKHLRHDACAPGCRCSYFAQTGHVLVDCSFSGLSTFQEGLPIMDNKEYGMQTKKITLVLRNNNIEDIGSLFAKVSKSTMSLIDSLDLSANNIEKLDTHYLPENITFLSLNNNKINEISEEVLDYIDTVKNVTLGNTPFSCTCSSLSLIKSLKSPYSRVSDKANISISCGSRGPVSSQAVDVESQVCPNHITTILAVCLIFSVLTLVSLIYLASRRKHVYVWLWSQPWLLRAFPEDWSLPYDVFLSYSHHQHEFVEKTLLHHLEQEQHPPYRCCVHGRDWLVGEVIPDQILASVEDSRRTVIVLSQQYTTAMWTRLEFRAAHTR